MSIITDVQLFLTQSLYVLIQVAALRRRLMELISLVQEVVRFLDRGLNFTSKWHANSKTTALNALVASSSQ